MGKRELYFTASQKEFLKFLDWKLSFSASSRINNVEFAVNGGHCHLKFLFFSRLSPLLKPHYTKIEKIWCFQETALFAVWPVNCCQTKEVRVFSIRHQVLWEHKYFRGCCSPLRCDWIWQRISELWGARKGTNKHNTCFLAIYRANDRAHQSYFKRICLEGKKRFKKHVVLGSVFICQQWSQR